MAVFKSLVLAAATAIVAIGSVPASAVTFASYGQTDSAATLRWVNGTGTGQTTSSNVGGRVYSTAVGGGGTTGRNPGSTAVSFNFLLSPLSSIGATPATFTLLGSTNLATTLDGPNTAGTGIEQAGIGGSFSFITTQAITVGDTVFAAGSNLLTGTFTNGRLTSTIGANSATLLLGSTVGQTLVYTSDFVAFEPSTAQSASFNLGGLDNLISVTPGRSLKSTRGVGSGGFDATIAGAEIVPEPEMWTLMIAGFGLVGVAMRRRKSRLAAING